MGEALHGETSIRASGVHLTLSGAVGSFKDADGTRAKLFRAFSTPPARRAATVWNGTNLPLPLPWPPVIARAKRRAALIGPPKR
jgi:hypothetical protein